MILKQFLIMVLKSILAPQLESTICQLVSDKIEKMPSDKVLRLLFRLDTVLCLLYQGVELTISKRTFQNYGEKPYPM